MIQAEAQSVQGSQTEPDSLHERRSPGQMPLAIGSGRRLAVGEERERLLRQILESIRAATNVEEAVERAITALGREMAASKVVVRLATEAELVSYAAEVDATHATHD